MSLYKAIKHGKEHRRTYHERGKYSSEVDPSCRPHGGGRTGWPCPYCERRRLFPIKRRTDAVVQTQDDWDANLEDDDEQS